MRNRPPDLFIERFKLLVEEAKQRGESIDDIADAIEVHRAQPYRWIRGERSPEGGNLVALADHFGVSTDWLWGRPGYEREPVKPLPPSLASQIEAAAETTAQEFEGNERRRAQEQPLPGGHRRSDPPPPS